MIAGCVRIIGQVTPVPSASDSVACEIAPIVLQTNGLSPWTSSHGWKWSEISANPNPACSARLAFSTSSSGFSSSDESE